MNRFNVLLLWVIIGIGVCGTLKAQKPFPAPQKLDPSTLRTLPKPNVLFKLFATPTKTLSDSTSTYSTMATGRRQYVDGIALVSVDGGPNSQVAKIEYVDSVSGANLVHHGSIVCRGFATDFLSAISAKLSNIGIKETSFNMATVLTDATLIPVEKRQYDKARITEIEFPAVSASDKDALEIRMEFDAENATSDFSASDKVSPPSKRNGAKSALASNFMVELAGTPQPRVSSVGSITLEVQRSTTVTNGKSQITDQSYTLSDFNIEVPNSAVQVWSDWFQSPTRASTHKEVTIHFRTPDLKSDVMALVLSDVDIISMSSSSSSGSQSIPRQTIGLRPKKFSLVINK